MASQGFADGLQYQATGCCTGIQHTNGTRAKTCRTTNARLQILGRILAFFSCFAHGSKAGGKISPGFQRCTEGVTCRYHAVNQRFIAHLRVAHSLHVRDGSGERVDFAIRLPGKDDGAVVWLPIDAKFPIEDYQRLIDAVEPAAIEEAAKAIETRLKNEARSIRDKYVAPPHTTDFAVLYLPIEGLYAEALRRPALSETLQRDYRVTLAGPTTLAAMLNSLQMGFRTLAIEQRSAEVWAVLGAVKTEFGKFGEALAHTKKKLDEASNSISKAEVRTRQLSRKLKEVEALPAADSEQLIGVGDFDGEDE